MIFPHNISKHLSIDETSLSHGELYTVFTNKAAKGKKGAIVAIALGTKAEEIIKVIKKILVSKRKKMKEITLDMAGKMVQIAKQCFPSASPETSAAVNLPQGVFYLE